MCVISSGSAYKHVPYDKTSLSECIKPLLQCSLNRIMKYLRVLLVEDKTSDGVMHFVTLQSHTSLRYDQLGDKIRFFQSHHRALSL